MDAKELTELFKASGEDYRRAFNEGLEAAAKATCGMCRDGLVLQKSKEGFWSHPQRGAGPEGRTCHSDLIWKIFNG